MAVRRRWRLGLYVLFVVPLSLLAMETSIRLGYRVLFGEWFAHGEQRAAMRAMRGVEEGVPRTLTNAGRYFWRGGLTEVLHPYLGFIPEPAAGAKSPVGILGQVRSRSDDKRVVGVLDGSFAVGLCLYGGDELRQELGKLGLRIELLCLAGALDVVVNVDGFNDVVLLLVENVPKGVFPIYPRA